MRNEYAGQVREQMERNKEKKVEKRKEELEEGKKMKDDLLNYKVLVEGIKN
jgi:hypothetical protein